MVTRIGSLIGAIAIVALVACRDRPPTCEGMADRVLALFGSADDQARAVRAAFANRCDRDGWSPTTRTCISATTALTEPRQCRVHLTAEQRERLDAELAAIDRRHDQRTAELPASCVRYEQLLANVAACTALPDSVRESLVQSYAAARRSWATGPTGDRTKLESLCSGAIHAVKQAASECPGADRW